MANGPGAYTDDGCAVEVYRRLPVGEDLHVIHLVAGEGATILDLGAGAGRLADPLSLLGHRVVAVDDSAEMLTHVTHARTVRSRIEHLDLPTTFDVVVLASHLINNPCERRRHQLLLTVARHLAAGGRALVQWHPPVWFDSLSAGDVWDEALGDMNIQVAVSAVREDGALLDAVVRYVFRGTAWTHGFTTRRILLRDLQLEARAAGLAIHPPDDPAVTWLLATIS
ncbi:class I SAM-dependent methyltransferase [Klenkia terrae]|jgi:SAM-dependent methyltransferase|uniref:Methyltransferase domain-containing protein n=1 Tax=Klenkia terrae TaxID=1052259 RepID=A0ABU8E4T0_9ACTN|nr:methyltransferase domain-containing protein [Klenkia terrae]SSC22238.1 SAM-dependent methyltransferase [Klenkia terrae]